MQMKTLAACAAAFLLSGAVVLHAEDWPEWRGRGRLGVWNETGILERFPEGGLEVLWRTPIGGGYAGPAVAAGRVFVTDYVQQRGLRGVERAWGLDEETGRVLWMHEWEVNYAGLGYAVGPRATPTVDGDRVYFLGARGALYCLDAGTGEVRWSTDFVEDYGVDPLTWAWDWGFASAPLVDGERLIAMVGAAPDALVVAFDKLTGEELWRALPTESEPGYSPPIIITAGGVRQLIVWHPLAVSSLDPATGDVFWEQPFDVANTLSVATPVQSGDRLLVSAFYNGSVMLGLDRDNIGARVLWRGASDNEIQTDGLHALVTTPLILGDYVYGIGSYGQMRCLHAATGERVWETQQVVNERVRWASAQIVRNHDRVFINNDRGELIIARLAPDGYRELSRTQLIEPTSPPGNRRELRAVNWSHPAYANKRIYARNDEEIISASLAAR